MVTMGTEDPGESLHLWLLNVNINLTVHNLSFMKSIDNIHLLEFIPTDLMVVLEEKSGSQSRVNKMEVKTLDIKWRLVD